ncbi:hypothetical protein EP7_003559 [Isosphaeraceae bacterium EP7]
MIAQTQGLARLMSQLRSVALALAACVPASVFAQEDDLIVRQGPPARDSLEVDSNGDGVPDGWYNLRDGAMAPGGINGKTCIRFENRKPGRPARISRAFGVDGRTTEAIVMGLWIRLPEAPRSGERVGDDPALIVDFLGDGLRTVGRGSMGPWTGKNVGAKWARVVKRIPVPPETLDVIFSVGLLGATGVLEMDDLTVELIPRGGQPTTNLVPNGDFELGSPEPSGWVVEKGARRSYPGDKSTAALELPEAGARALVPLALPVDQFGSLELSVRSKGTRLRGSGGVGAIFFFVDADGRPIPIGDRPILTFGGTYDWRTDKTRVNVPKGTRRAVLQFEKLDGQGTLKLDDVTVTAGPDPQAGTWTPDHAGTDTKGWEPVEGSSGIEPGSALDASALLDAPAGKHGFVKVDKGRLHFADGGRARFFGVTLLPPTAFLEAKQADDLADRLARMGVNLVRLGDLDAAYGPGQSLIDDNRDDTLSMDTVALARLDHLIAALKKRGIYLAIELHSSRRFREGDNLGRLGVLPPGGGPAAAFDPEIGKRIREFAKALVGHMNPETGLALKNDPAFAWLTIAGELSLFDLIDDPGQLNAGALASLREHLKGVGASGRRGWQALENATWPSIARDLRGAGVRVPIAGVSHWRREPEFLATLMAPGLDLVDDRLYWAPSLAMDPDRRSFVLSTEGGLAAMDGKRKDDHPYVIGQWCDQTNGAWAQAFEGAELLLAARTMAAKDWDAMARRGIFLHPKVWGSASPGTGGAEDIYRIPEALNANPQVYDLWPHAATLALRRPKGDQAVSGTVPGWDAQSGRILIDTPHTQGVAGWPGGLSASCESIAVSVENTYASVVASSLGDAPIAEAKRLLVTAVGRVEPTGMTFADESRRDLASPGTPPLLAEPIRGSVTWNRKGAVKAYALDATGKRAAEVKLDAGSDGPRLRLDGNPGTRHWELIAD